MSLGGGRRDHSIEIPWDPHDGDPAARADVTVQAPPHPLAPLVMPLFIAAHVPLALAMRQSPAVATLHALATLLVGLRWAATNSIDRVAYLVAYIAGAEVLWRMTKAQVFWEYGKYAASLVLLVALVRTRTRWIPILPTLYFALLLPSIAILVRDQDPGEVRNQVSFILSGPFSFMVTAWFYARLVISRAELMRLFLSLLASITGISTIALTSTVTTAHIRFTTESNFTTSGGFGPNQVSTILALGALAALLCILIRDNNRRVSGVFLLGWSILLATQSAMTFSRSGLYCLSLSTLLLFVCITRDPTVLLKVAAALVVTLLVARYAIMPMVDEFTGGAITARFQETTTTSRTDFMVNDIALWMEHPLLGVGPGGSSVAHHGVTTHSEATRLLAEHGYLGFLALLLLGLMAVMNFRKGATPLDRGIRASLLCYGLLLIVSNGVRIFAPSFILGLAFATFRLDEAAKRKPLRPDPYP